MWNGDMVESTTASQQQTRCVALQCAPSVCVDSLLPQFKGMKVVLTGDSKLAVRVNGYLFFSVNLAIDQQTGQAIPLEWLFPNCKNIFAK